jgi:hypothetical protein
MVGKLHESCWGNFARIIWIIISHQSCVENVHIRTTRIRHSIDVPHRVDVFAYFDINTYSPPGLHGTQLVHNHLATEALPPSPFCPFTGSRASEEMHLDTHPAHSRPLFCVTVLPGISWYLCLCAACWCLRVRVRCTPRPPRCVSTGPDDLPVCGRASCEIKSSLYINYRQPYGSLSNVLRKLDLT